MSPSCLRQLAALGLVGLTACGAPEDATIALDVYERFEPIGADACWRYCPSGGLVDPSIEPPPDDASVPVDLCDPDEFPSCRFIASGARHLAVVRFEGAHFADPTQVSAPALVATLDDRVWAVPSTGWTRGVDDGTGSCDDGAVADDCPIRKTPWFSSSLDLPATAAGSLTLTATAAADQTLTATAGPYPVVAPDVTATTYVWRGGPDGCWQPCGGPTLDDDLSSLDVAPVCDGPPGCAVVSAQSQVRVLASYPGRTDVLPGAQPTPTMRATLNQVRVAALEIADAWRPLGVVDDRVVAENIVDIPLLEPGALRLEVEAPSGAVAVATPAGLMVGDPSIELHADPADGSELAAGLGAVTLTVQAPAGVHSVSVSSWVGGLVQAGAVETITLDPAVDADGVTYRGGAKAIAVPGQAGQDWQLAVRSAHVESNPIGFALRSPIRPAVGVASTPPLTPADTSTTPSAFPPRARLERPACRLAYVSVEAPDAPSGGRASLTTSAGSFGTTTTTQVDVAEGFGVAVLDLGTSPVHAGFVDLSVEATGLEAASTRWHLSPVRPWSAVVAPAASQVVVGSGGSTVSMISGRVETPLPGIGPSADVPIDVVVSVVETSAATPSCGPIAAAASIRCDPARHSGNAGGCLLTPSAWQLQPNGQFTLMLAAGVCWAGRIEVELWARPYTDDDGACLGELPVSDVAVPLALPIEIEYLPE